MNFNLTRKYGMRKLIVAVSLALNLTAFAEVPHPVRAQGCVGNFCCPQTLYCGYYEGCGLPSQWSYSGSPGAAFDGVEKFDFQWAYVENGAPLTCQYTINDGHTVTAVAIKTSKLFYIKNIIGQWKYLFASVTAQCLSPDAGVCGVNNG